MVYNKSVIVQFHFNLKYVLQLSLNTPLGEIIRSEVGQMHSGVFEQDCLVRWKFSATKLSVAPLMPKLAFCALAPAETIHVLLFVSDQVKQSSIISREIPMGLLKLQH